LSTCGSRKSHFPPDVFAFVLFLVADLMSNISQFFFQLQVGEKADLRQCLEVLAHVGENVDLWLPQVEK